MVRSASPLARNHGSLYSIHVGLCISKSFGHDGVVNSRRPTRVLMVGPAPSSPRSRGGMATVTAQMLDFDGQRASIRFVPTFDDRALLQRWLAGAAGMLRSASIAAVGDVDVVHVHLSHGGSVLRKGLPLWFARRRGIPTVIHGHSYNFAQWYSGLSSRLQSVVRAALSADHWLVLGEGIGKDYVQALSLAPERVSVLYNPAPEVVDDGSAELYDRSDDSAKVVAVALGRLGTRKGSFDIVEAVAQSPQRVRDRLAVVLAGDGEVDAVRLAVAEASGNGADIRVHDWLGPEERDAVLESASVFLLPSYDEGLPMALLEAMAAGLAPITSAVGAIPEIISDGQNGLLVSPGDVTELSAALTRLVDDADARKRLATAAQEKARTLSRAAWETQIEDLWDQLRDTRGTHVAPQYETGE